MQRDSWKLWAAAGLSAGLLELPFPLAGPMPPWRSVFAWFGLVPLLWAVLSQSSVERPRPLRRAFLLAYLCGVLWYCGNCYWVRDTMCATATCRRWRPRCCCIGFSLVLGLYFGFFGLSVVLVRRARAARGWRWLPRRSCGPRWNWPLRGSPAFPGINWATRRWTTHW